MDFKLDDKFIKKYSKIKPKFGFNGLGELVYLRTYSRLKPDGSNESWFETVRRVVEGTYSIQKRHINKYGLGWDETKAQRSAQEMYERMFDMKFLPPGRGLWAMGSDVIEQKGLYVALNNCAFVSTDNLEKDLTRPFEFMMDFSMLGVGVGFDVKGADSIEIQRPGTSKLADITKDLTYVIPDTREGWVNSLKLALNAYFKGDYFPTFDYTQIRPYGALIKTFGGKASGPAPLKKLHSQIKDNLDKRIGKTISETDITNIMNMIGVCVVAGNVRRTAQISFGDPNSSEYLKLKDYSWDNDTKSYIGANAERAEYGWASNNSIFASTGMDYTEVAEQTALNGEPGYAWLENMRQFGRMGKSMDDPKYGKDLKAKGGNPCLEQTLESYEMCCLVETFPTKHENEYDFQRTLKFAYLYAKTVTLGTTHWTETNRVQLRNRRIGASISGVTQFLETEGINTLKKWLNTGYTVLQRYDNLYSDWLAVPRSIKTTSIKPSGTVSLLPGVTPGMHYPESNYYIRRMRISTKSDLLENIKEAGYHIEPDVNDPENTAVVEIPVHIPNVRTVSEVSMWEQLSLAAFLQEHWADNQVSCTITFSEKEKHQIKHALDYFQYKLKGVSFLPKLEKASYAQMPYEEITEDTYKQLSKNIKTLKVKGIGEESKPEQYCDTDTCTI